MTIELARAYLVIEEELARLRGLGSVATALYLLCLKGRTDSDGWVVGASHKSMTDALAPRDSRAGGRRRPAPTAAQVRGAIDLLESAGLIVVDRPAARDTGRLCVRLLFPGNVKT